MTHAPTTTERYLALASRAGELRQLVQELRREALIMGTRRDSSAGRMANDHLDGAYIQLSSAIDALTAAAGQ